MKQNSKKLRITIAAIPAAFWAGVATFFMAGYFIRLSFFVLA
jgi:hypothetical protein